MGRPKASSFDAEAFIRDVTRQDAAKLRGYFTRNAVIRWHNTGEQFSVDEYIRANCEYPGAWAGVVERTETTDSILIVVAKIWGAEAAFRATSFLQLVDGKIDRLDEYWGDIGDPPGWRKDMRIGKAILD